MLKRNPSSDEQNSQQNLKPQPDIYLEMGFGEKRLAEIFAAIENEKSIALAVSGGVDSLALMLLIQAWLYGAAKKQGQPKILVYSVDHQLRKEAKGECEKVKSIAENMGFEHKNLVWRGAKPEQGVMQAARIARYGLMGQQMEKDGVKILLSAHHMDDQGETVMMRLAHGSGVGGLGAMREFSSVEGTRIFRPLLGFEKRNLEKIVRWAGLTPCFDPSNGDEKYERVRWRGFLHTAKEMGLSALTLGRFARRMGRADDALEYFAQEYYQGNVSADQFGVYCLAKSLIETLPREIIIRVLGKMIFAVSGGRNAGELGKLEAIVGKFFQNGFRGEVVGGCVIVPWKEKLVIFREQDRIQTGKSKLLPGEKNLWDQRFSIINRGKDALVVQSALSVNRKLLKNLPIGIQDSKMDWVRAAPLVVDENANIVAIGTCSFSDSLESRLVKFAGKPLVNSGGFAAL